MYFVFWQTIFSTEFSVFCTLISFKFRPHLSSCEAGAQGGEGHVWRVNRTKSRGHRYRQGSILKNGLAEIIVVKHPKRGDLLWNEQMLIHLFNALQSGSVKVPFFLQNICFPLNCLWIFRYPHRRMSKKSCFACMMWMCGFNSYFYTCWWWKNWISNWDEGENSWTVGGTESRC